ncbi:MULTISPECIES: DUF928 domain-containing protein [Aerosakkonema]|uniref:DUF928 domain-containing protein n=1 Tax=Aerosakkonema TaxID=1246629 RepID=UPI0035B6CF14
MNINNLLMKLPRLPINIFSFITWPLVSFTSVPAQVWAQSFTSVDSIAILQTKQTQQEKPDFSGDGRPGRRTGGGSRNPCLIKDPPLTALIPISNSGKTVSERPTFWFHVPYSVKEAPSGEFVLQEEGGKDVYRTSFTLPGTPGFVSLSIPSTKAPLEINKWYRWYFKLYCEAQKTSSPIFVEGWVQRVELTPDLEKQLKAAAPKEYTVYTSNSLWYDAVASLAKLRSASPSNSTLNDDWVNLLKLREVGLEKISQAPIVGDVILP